MNLRIFKLFLTLLFFVLIQTSCDSVEPNDSNRSRDYGTGTDYLIYSAVLKTIQTQDDEIIVISDSTQYESFISTNIEYFLNNLPDTEEETLNNYISQNQTKIQLKGIENINFLFQSEYISSVKNDVHVTLPRIGYNENNTQAILTMGVLYAPLAGSGSLILLEFENGVWIIKNSIMTCIS